MIGMFIQDWKRHSFRVAWWNLRHFGKHWEPLGESEASELLNAMMAEHAEHRKESVEKGGGMQRIVSRHEGYQLFRHKDYVFPRTYRNYKDRS